MKATLDIPSLRAAVEWCARTAPARSPIPQYMGVAIEPREDGLRLHATDGDAWAISDAPASLSEPSRLAVSARLLAEVTKAMPRGGRVDLIAEDGASLQVTAGSLRARLPLMPVEDYPRPPAMPEVIGEVPADLLHRQLVAAAAIGTDGWGEGVFASRASVALEADASRLLVGSTDSRVLLVAELPWSSGGPTEPLCAPLQASTARALAEVTKGADGDVALGLPPSDPNKVGVLRAVAGGRQLAVRVGVGKLPHREVFDGQPGSTRTIKADIGELVGLVRRVSVLAEVTEAKTRRVDLQVGAGRISVRATGGGDLTDSIEVDHSPDWDADPWEHLLVNPNYLIDLLSALPASRVHITAGTGPAKAMVIRPADTAAHPAKALLMPIRPHKEGA